VVLKKENVAGGKEPEAANDQSDTEMKEGDEAKQDDLKRKKIQFFKFWPKHIL
jgi:hypothetical protein